LGVALFMVKFNNWLICLTNRPTFSGQENFRTHGIPPGRGLNDSAIKPYKTHLEHARRRYECGIVTGQICLPATVSTFPAARRDGANELLGLFIGRETIRFAAFKIRMRTTARRRVEILPFDAALKAKRFKPIPIGPYD
jgi:hypothetical protein